MVWFRVLFRGAPAQVAGIHTDYLATNCVKQRPWEIAGFEIMILLGQLFSDVLPKKRRLAGEIRLFSSWIR